MLIVAVYIESRPNIHFTMFYFWLLFKWGYYIISNSISQNMETEEESDYVIRNINESPEYLSILENSEYETLQEPSG